MVYENCKIYGPYISKKDNRLRCITIFPNGVKRTISYPKYLMEAYLDRYLESNETIDHIDGNPLNNSIENLQVLDRKQHSYLDAKRNENIIVNCAFCGKQFVISGEKIHDRNRNDRKHTGYFCSKQCTGKYGKLVQIGLIKPVICNKIIPKTYKVKSAQGETLDVEVG